MWLGVFYLLWRIMVRKKEDREVETGVHRTRSAAYNYRSQRKADRALKSTRVEETIRMALTMFLMMAMSTVLRDIFTVSMILHVKCLDGHGE